ncbi:MAG TPA: AAA family ATPase [Candidatus Saccharimonadales bacterium]|nr:AAA family ATPase [Candidatus Saccharimonadales bacterium]
MRLIGIAGTNGAGKDTVGNLLAEQYNLLFVSVSDLLREEARARNLPVTREVLREISAEWRREFGLGVLVDRAIKQFRGHGGKYSGVVACPMRNEGEAQHLKDLGGTLVWVDANPHVRYERVMQADRGRPGEDDKTFEEFFAEEEAEMKRLGDKATLSTGDVKKIADVFIENDDNDLKKLRAILDKKIKID